MAQQITIHDSIIHNIRQKNWLVSVAVLRGPEWVHVLAPMPTQPNLVPVPHVGLPTQMKISAKWHIGKPANDRLRIQTAKMEHGEAFNTRETLERLPVTLRLCAFYSLLQLMDS